MPRVSGFIGGSYRGSSYAGGVERSVNWFPHRTSSRAAKAQWLLYPTPGLRQLASVPDVDNRGVFAYGSSVWMVSGHTLREYNAQWELQDAPDGGFGRIEPDADEIARTTPVTRFAASGPPNHEMMLVADGRAWLLKLANNSTDSSIQRDAHEALVFNPGAADQEAVPPGSSADDIGFFRGFFLLLDSETSTLRASDLTDGTTWNGLRVSQRLQTADPWVALRVTPRGQVWLFGELQTDVYWHTGRAPMPFEPIPGGLINSGTPARFSPAVIDERVCWLARNSTGGIAVMVADASFRTAEISSPEVAAEIAKYENIDKAIGIGYRESGHTFYALMFPDDRATWVYDFQTGEWHERSSLLHDRADCWAVRSYTYFSGAHLVGTVIDGGLYEMSDKHYTEGGTRIRRVRQTGHVDNERRRVFIHRLEADFERGVGPIGTMDNLSLEISADGGRTWRHVPAVKGLVTGDYRRRLLWHRLGSSRDPVFRLTADGDAPWRLVDSMIDVDVASH